MAKLHFRCDGYDEAWFVRDTTSQSSWLPADGSSPLVTIQPVLCTTSETGLFLWLLYICGTAQEYYSIPIHNTLV